MLDGESKKWINCIQFSLGIVVSTPIQKVISYPHGYSLTIIIGVIVSVFIITYFAKKYNKKINN